MKIKLARTLLSKKTNSNSLLIGLASFVILLFLFWMNEMTILPVNAWMTASGQQVFGQQEYWRLFTTTLIHGDLSHLGGNALFFTGFSILLYNYFGWTVFPLLSLVVGAVINYISLIIYPPEMTLVGISGVLYFMASFWMTLFVLLERKESLPRRLIIAAGLSLIFFFPEVFDIKTSYLAHALGFAFGIPMAGMVFWFNKKKFRSEEVWIVEMESDDLLYNEEEAYAMMLEKQNRCDQSLELCTHHGQIFT